MRDLKRGLLVGLFFAFTPAAYADGSFQTNDPLLNKIWASSVQTAKDMVAPGNLTTDWMGRPCAIALPTVILDGTVRDRCPFIGDEMVIDGTMNASTPRWGLQRSMLAWFASAQHGDGSIPSSPINDGSLVLFDYNGYWLQALNQYALYSGDLGFVRGVWPHVKKLIGWYAARARPDGLVVNDLGTNDYGFIRRHGTVVAYFNAQYVLVLQKASQLAGWIGKTTDASAWSVRAAAVGAASAPAFWDAAHGAFQDTTIDRTTHPQDGNSFAVLAGLGVPAQRASALNYLWAHNQRSYGSTIVDSTAWDGPDWGLLGSERVYPFMSYFEVRARFETSNDLQALNLIRREWGYMTTNGPGTTWETIGPYGGGPTDTHPSWDAGWSSGAAPALTAYVLGVQPSSPGFATFTVKPHTGGLAGGVSFASGTVPTPGGDIVVSWKQVRGKVLVTVKSPPGTKRI